MSAVRTIIATIVFVKIFSFQVAAEENDILARNFFSETVISSHKKVAQDFREMATFVIKDKVTDVLLDKKIDDQLTILSDGINIKQIGLQSGNTELFWLGRNMIQLATENFKKMDQTETILPHLFQRWLEREALFSERVVAQSEDTKEVIRLQAEDRRKRLVIEEALKIFESESVKFISGLKVEALRHKKEFVLSDFELLIARLQNQKSSKCVSNSN